MYMYLSKDMTGQHTKTWLDPRLGPFPQTSEPCRPATPAGFAVVAGVAFGLTLRLLAIAFAWRFWRCVVQLGFQNDPTIVPLLVRRIKLLAFTHRSGASVWISHLVLEAVHKWGRASWKSANHRLELWVTLAKNHAGLRSSVGRKLKVKTGTCSY